MSPAKAQRIFDPKPIDYLAAGFEMAYQMVKDHVPTERRIGDLLLSMEIKSKAFKLEIRAERKGAGN